VLRLFYCPYELRQEFFFLTKTLEVLYFNCHGLQKKFEPHNVCGGKTYEQLEDLKPLVRPLGLFYQPYELQQALVLLTRTQEVLYFNCHSSQGFF